MEAELMQWIVGGGAGSSGLAVGMVLQQFISKKGGASVTSQLGTVLASLAEVKTDLHNLNDRMHRIENRLDRDHA